MNDEPRLPTADELNERKKLLEKKMGLSDIPAEFAPDWLALATDYELIDSKANAAWCNLQYKKLIGEYEPRTRPARILSDGEDLSLPTPPRKLKTQRRADVD